jgi:hypothetical protein
MTDIEKKQKAAATVMRLERQEFFSRLTGCFMAHIQMPLCG